MPKKLFVFFLTGLMFANVLIPISGAAAPNSSNTQASSNVSVVIDGHERTFSQPPVIVNHYTMVPFRGIFEIFGAKVHWDGKTRTVTAATDDIELELTIDSDLASINGNPIKLAQPVIIINDSTMVPLRFVSEALGSKVAWSQKTRTVYIESSLDKNEDKEVADWEQQVVDLVNEERVKADLEPLELDVELSNVARIKSEDMRDEGYFDHFSPVYGSPFEMMEQFDITFLAAGENIAAGQDSPEAVVKAWMNSPGHKKNILSPDFTHTGVGYADGGSYRHYWTQQFIGR